MIETKGLRKSYPSGKHGRTVVDAVRGIDLDVQAGEIFGFLGPNGAGKTTTLRMLATLIRPDGGRALVAGADLLADPAEVRRRIGYVAQGGGTADAVSGREELVMQARMYGLRKADALRQTEDALKAFELTEFADRHCGTYSGGQRRRVDIALGVIHSPKVLFLDEPTVGLDPASRGQVWAEIKRLRTEGMTVVVTTHYLDEADALCDRVAIVDHGEVVVEGTPEALKREISGDVVLLGLAAGDAEPAADALRGQPALHRLERNEDGLRLYLDDGAAAIPQLLSVLNGAGIVPGTVQLQRPSLDDVFLARTGRSIEQS
ncbi:MULTISPECIES: daunorubicin resistance protein DrrA family ABC transporter ATP-binding protein [Kitasatospora]|uniref:Putative multidrug ABC transporter ATP-binding protein n=1 Tax=Kitasatospora setae (strain ATCC 33774 / DSM 43861 / JCM 3304 / KCC A-0304 / NBRC 14216 / KM-6054) TaxID=452652 RepID=E4N2X0_KITSK|nr:MULTISPECIES: daunorubicin resistance protein DrrA family ABC transporter ATP-binding protein [Kitasatospora]BAJ32504.1 putative multidrug ABC transporter ATP-binding protein [Kitasatospora setae KM-6054]